jgi:hypothetical protein
MQLYHFDQVIKHTSKAIECGGQMGDKWLAQLVERGQEWDDILLEILGD